HAMQHGQAPAGDRSIIRTRLPADSYMAATVHGAGAHGRCIARRRRQPAAQEARTLRQGCVTIPAIEGDTMATYMHHGRALMLLLAMIGSGAPAATVAAGQDRASASEAAVETPRLRRFGTAEGLPSRMVLALAEDHQGHVWAATDGGLARYDGVAMQTWRHDPQVEGSLPGNEIETMLVDQRDRVWLGINGVGLVRMGADRQGFEVLGEINSRCEGQFWTLAEQGQGLWIGTSAY